MKDLEVLKVLDKMFKEKYTPTTKLEDDGHSISRANAILNYKDGDTRVTFRASKKAALQMYFNFMKTKGRFVNIDYEKFEEKYNQGIELEEIEKNIRPEQLPGMDGKEKTVTKGEKKK